MCAMQAQSRAGYQQGRAQHSDEAHAEMLRGKPHPASVPAGSLLAEFISFQSSAERPTLPEPSAWHRRASPAARDGADGKGRRWGGGVDRGGNDPHIPQEPQSLWEGFHMVKGVCYTPADQERQTAPGTAVLVGLKKNPSIEQDNELNSDECHINEDSHGIPGVLGRLFVQGTCRGNEE